MSGTALGWVDLTVNSRVMEEADGTEALGWVDSTVDCRTASKLGDSGDEDGGDEGGDNSVIVSLIEKTFLESSVRSNELCRIESRYDDDDELRWSNE